MKESQSYTESLLSIVTGIKKDTILLPEFQRDFRWELDQTYDLFDSLIRDIFIGTIIYGKPAFAMTLREIDQRPRKGKGSTVALKTHDYTADQLSILSQTKGLRIVLDGQQRITSIYRAMVGIDRVYAILRPDLDPVSIAKLSLEEMVASVAGEESPAAPSISLFDAYRTEDEGLDDGDLNRQFAATLFAQRVLASADKGLLPGYEKIYRRGVSRIRDLYKQEKMLSYYLLDMGVEKFCIFFERSNSRGIQLNFTDILAAKLYQGFNLRKKIDDYRTGHPDIQLNREVVIRSIAYIVGVENVGTIAIDKGTILKNLTAADFQKHWDTVCRLYAEALDYLLNQHYVVSQGWMPSENMLIPLMIFLREIKSFDTMSENQRRFLQFWYWAAVFSNKYSSASNEAIIEDCEALTHVARNRRIPAPYYFSRLRPTVTEPDDLYSYTRRTSAIYRGVLNLIGYRAHGCKDWNSTHKLTSGMRLEDHHVYPRGYIDSAPKFDDLSQDDAERLVDCVVNRVLIPKLLNIHIGKRSPSDYLSEIQTKTNANLDASLSSHLLPPEMIGDPAWDASFGYFLKVRAESIFDLIEDYTIEPVADLINCFGTTQPVDGQTAEHRIRLKDLIAVGKVLVGDAVYVPKNSSLVARIVDGDNVEYKGKRISINAWGQEVTGWPSINIYQSVRLVRTGRPLADLRSN